jgi:DNA-binding transcriptional ArsR family regulator
VPLRCGSGIALLADPTRRRIIAALAAMPRRPSRLAADLAVSRPAVARQLRLLEDADLIVAHAVAGDGRGILYTINPRRHGAITAWLAGTDVGREDAEADRAARSARQE